MKKIIFTLPAEALGEATKALLLGDFNDWSLDKAIGLEVQKNGTLSAAVELEPGKSYEYRFLLDNGTWINDWSAEQYVRSAFGVENSLITVPLEEILEVAEAPATAKTKAPKKASAKKTAAPKEKKAKAAETVAAKDDLTKIEGIGPKIARLLEAESIITFKDLSKATGKKLKAILEAAGSKFQMHDPASWPKQAKLAAAGKWEELKELQDKLVGGK